MTNALVSCSALLQSKMSSSIQQLLCYGEGYLSFDSLIKYFFWPWSFYIYSTYASPFFKMNALEDVEGEKIWTISFLGSLILTEPK